MTYRVYFFAGDVQIGYLDVRDCQCSGEAETRARLAVRDHNEKVKASGYGMYVTPQRYHAVVL